MLVLLRRFALQRRETAKGKRPAFNLFNRAACAMIVAVAVCTATSSPSHAAESIGVELNKLEPHGNSCRIYMVFANKTDGQINSFKTDLIFFDTDGVIARRIVVEGAPLSAGKTKVKLFDLTELACETISRVLLNDIAACEPVAPGECLALTSTSSRGAIEFIR